MSKMNRGNLWSMDAYRSVSNFIKNGDNINAKYYLQKLVNFTKITDVTGITLLHCSAECGNEVITLHLIKQGCQINAEDFFGNTPLKFAIQKSHVTIVDILLKNNADIYITDTLGNSVLPIAISDFIQTKPESLKRKAQFNILEKLIDKTNQNFLANEVFTTHLLLHKENSLKIGVVATANVKLVKAILKNGYSVEFHESVHGFTALHLSIIFAKFDNIKLLIEHGATVDSTDLHGHSALFYYILYCQNVDENSKILKILLEHDTNLFRKKYSHLESILTSVNKTTVEIVLQKMIDSGIDLTLIHFSDNNSFLHVLLQNQNVDINEIVDKLNIPFDVNACNFKGVTAISLAISRLSVREVEFLLKQGVDANTVIDGLPILLYMLELIKAKGWSNESKYELEITELLLMYGADAQLVIGDKNSLLQNFYLLGHAGYTLDLYAFLKLILAHVAQLGALGGSLLTNQTRKDIESSQIFKSHFDLYTQQLEKMKTIEVYNRVTLFNIATDKESKLKIYARNQDFILAFNTVVNMILDSYPTYSNIVQRRIAKALHMIEVEKKAAFIIEELTGVCSDAYFHIIDKIMSYLNLRELQYLCKIKTIFFMKK